MLIMEGVDGQIKAMLGHKLEIGAKSPIDEDLIYIGIMPQKVLVRRRGHHRQTGAGKSLLQPAQDRQRQGQIADPVMTQEKNLPDCRWLGRGAKTTGQQTKGP
ncbi:MAG: hypothetical protein A2512_10840 [Deltaproteobacteria bacterium RIFOXYD12_FULL_56_24]|nr:MAG: hypothetical protein A2512_10840 [Deltaproteobacteria bacterium RIFOXYD12_FULL_56_24]